LWIKYSEDAGGSNQGYAGVLFNLGCMYAEGKGVARRDEEAVQRWKKAEDSGLA